MARRPAPGRSSPCRYTCGRAREFSPSAGLLSVLNLPPPATWGWRRRMDRWPELVGGFDSDCGWSCDRDSVRRARSHPSSVSSQVCERFDDNTLLKHILGSRTTGGRRRGPGHGAAKHLVETATLPRGRWRSGPAAGFLWRVQGESATPLLGTGTRERPVPYRRARRIERARAGVRSRSPAASKTYWPRERLSANM